MANPSFLRSNPLGRGILSFLRRKLLCPQTPCHLCHAMFYFMLLCHFDHLASLACHVYFILCITLFEIHFLFILYPSCILILVHIFFISLILLDPFFYSCQKGREYNRESIGLMHIRKGRNSIEEMHILRGRRHLFMRKHCFVLFYIMFVYFFFFLYGALSFF